LAYDLSFVGWDQELGGSLRIRDHDT
jgi:hypothetical protein